MQAGRTLSFAEFERFRDWFYRQTGIYFEEARLQLVSRLLEERMAALGAESFGDWFAHLQFRDGGEEFQALIDKLTVKETYFLREEYQLKALVQNVLDEVMSGKPAADPIKLWCIPSATGEEAYSLAIYLLEHWPRVDAVEILITASDIDRNALSRAREGIYGSYALRNLSRALLERYFEPLDGSRHRVIPALRESIDFRHANVNDPRSFAGLGPVDVIFCRNLLIYFDDRSRRRAAENFYDLLRPGGFIFLGHSESMSRISSLFEVRRYPEAFVYQKPRS